MPVARLRDWHSEETGEQGRRLTVWCEPCHDLHAVELVAMPEPWTWDGNLEAPTINPSIAVGGVQWPPGSGFHMPRHRVQPGGRTMCHSHIRQGRWEYLGDCTHDLAARTVPLPPIPEGLFGDG